MTEPRKMVFLGALDVEAGETLAIELPADLDPDAVKLAIEKANLERAAEKAAELKRLRELFHLPDETKGRT